MNKTHAFTGKVTTEASCDSGSCTQRWESSDEIVPSMNTTIGIAAFNLIAWYAVLLLLYKALRYPFASYNIGLFWSSLFTFLWAFVSIGVGYGYWKNRAGDMPLIALFGFISLVLGVVCFPASIFITAREIAKREKQDATPQTDQITLWGKCWIDFTENMQRSMNFIGVIAAGTLACSVPPTQAQRHMEHFQKWTTGFCFFRTTSFKNAGSGYLGVRCKDFIPREAAKTVFGGILRCF